MLEISPKYASQVNASQVNILEKTTNNSPFYRYGGKFEFYCFKYLLWDAQGANLPPQHPIIDI